jgi:predicted transcriptional regulator
LLVPCEVAIKTVLPSIRALMANTLMEKKEMKEKQVAQLLGISQSAVSKYSNRVRGTKIPIDRIPEVQTLVDQMINYLLFQPNQKTEIMKLFCQACTLIRKDGFMCRSCHQNVPSAGVNGCDFCTSQENSALMSN